MWSNSIWALAALAVYWAAGILLVRQLVGGRWLDAVAPGWILGSGLASLGLLAVSLTGAAILPALPVPLALVLVAALAWRLLRPTPAGSDPSGLAPGERPRWIAWIIPALLGLLLFSTLLEALAQPETPFDALHNWSFKALSTAVNGRPFQGYWPLELFPNHVPFLAAFFMALQGFPQESVVHLIPFLFYVALLGILVPSSRRLAGNWAWGWPMALAMVPANLSMLFHTDRLYCDLPLAAIHLAAIGLAILWFLHGRLPAAFLSGVFAGLCAWTKTEGVMLAAGIGGAFFLAEWVRTDVPLSIRLKGFGVFIAGLLFAGAPWPIVLAIRGISAESSGHIGHSIQWARVPAILSETWNFFSRQGQLCGVAFLFFLFVGFSKKTRALWIFLAASIAAGFLHIWLPLLVLPGDAFGGWREFMDNGLDRYAMHFMPAMLLSAALVARTGRAAGLDRLLRLLMIRPSPPQT